MIALLAKVFLRKTDNIEAVRHKYGMICGSVGICLNLLLSVFKIVLGVLTGSLAIQADGFNNLVTPAPPSSPLQGSFCPAKSRIRSIPSGMGAPNICPPSSSRSSSCSWVWS